MAQERACQMAMKLRSWYAGPGLRGHRQWKPSPGPTAVPSGPGDTAASVWGAGQHRLPLLSPTVCAPGRPATSKRCP